MTTSFKPNDFIPTSPSGEFCPDWPGRCICPIEPAHTPLPQHRSECGHCGENTVVVPRQHGMKEHPDVHELVMAGALYCPRCRRVMCADCGDKDDHEVARDCSARGISEAGRA